jgi:hypothetical protein
MTRDFTRELVEALEAALGVKESVEVTAKRLAQERGVAPKEYGKFLKHCFKLVFDVRIAGKVKK